MLLAFCNYLHIWVTLAAVDEVGEANLSFWMLNGFFPFAAHCAAQASNLGF
ncbi:hypothetical protein D3C73_1571760 [compost metagenome]